MNFNYDLLVIGAGPGGLAASIRAAEYGARVGLIEQDLVGGTCVIRGCIPEKLMSFAAEFADSSKDATGYGWNRTPCSFDWQQFITAMDQEVHRLSEVHTHSLEKAGVELIHGHATFLDAHTIQVKTDKFTADKILIAVGAKAVKPEIPGIEHAITSQQLFNLREQPKHIAIIGGNYIAVKLAGIMRCLGSQVTQILCEEAILSDFDVSIRSNVTDGMVNRGSKIFSGTRIKEIQPNNEKIDLMIYGNHQDILSVDSVLYVIKRVPNTSNLGLENINIKIEKNAVVVDEYNCTTEPNIFAVGDCINLFNFTPVAIAQGRAFADTQFGAKPRTISCEYVPMTVSSHPEAATVGLSEEQAREQLGDSIICYCNEFRPLLQNLTEREEKTLVKLVVDKNTDKVLGAHMVGAGAIEIIQCLALSLRLGATKKDFDQTIGIHPSAAEEFFTLRQVA